MQIVSLKQLTIFSVLFLLNIFLLVPRSKVYGWRGDVLLNFSGRSSTIDAATNRTEITVHVVVKNLIAFNQQI